jgi:predicted  nucleic acid-binding Zn-ribbon protein
MPHKCTKCGRVYEDGSDVILKGCECGNRLFYYLKTNKKPSSAQPKVEKVEISKDDISNIMVGDGVYKIDVDSLMKKEPIIVSGGEGRYIVSISSVFKNLRKKKR